MFLYNYAVHFKMPRILMVFPGQNFRLLRGGCHRWYRLGPDALAACIVAVLGALSETTTALRIFGE
jgi:hypothetical protein